MSEVMELNSLLLTYEDGDGHGWQTEFDWLRQNHPQELSALLTSIEQIGMQSPILLGPDNRVWDGHHRLCIAYDLGFSHVPIHYAADDKETAS